MDLNATLLGQMITFAIFIWFTMRYVWPPLMKALEDRRAHIADGLAAAEKGQRDLEAAQYEVTAMINDAKTQSVELIEQANQRSVRIIEEAKERAREEGARLLESANADIEKAYTAAHEQLIGEVANLATLGAEKILRKQLDVAANQALVDDLIKEIR